MYFHSILNSITVSSFWLIMVSCHGPSSKQRMEVATMAYGADQCMSAAVLLASGI